MQTFPEFPVCIKLMYCLFREVTFRSISGFGDELTFLLPSFLLFLPFFLPPSLLPLPPFAVVISLSVTLELTDQSVLFCVGCCCGPSSVNDHPPPLSLGVCFNLTALVFNSAGLFSQLAKGEREGSSCDSNAAQPPTFFLGVNYGTMSVVKCRQSF